MDKKCTCLRCGSTWTPRTEKPIQCPRCKSPFWDKPRKGDNKWYRYNRKDDGAAYDDGVKAAIDSGKAKEDCIIIPCHLF